MVGELKDPTGGAEGKVLARFSQHCSKGTHWGCRVKPLLGSANTVQCQVRLGYVKLGKVGLG